MRTRARDRRLTPPERISRRPILTWRPVARAPLKRGETRLAGLTRRGGREERATLSRHLFDGSDRPDSDSLQRRPSRVRSTGSASTPSGPQEADSSAAPRRLQSLIIRGTWGPGRTSFPRHRRRPRTDSGDGRGRKVSPRAAGC
jgi:hypothetical protein